MKNINDKFKTEINFVKPLYRHVKPNKVTTHYKIGVVNTGKLRGNEIDIKGKFGKEKSSSDLVPYYNNTEKYQVLLPGECQNNIRTKFTTKYYSMKNESGKEKMLGIKETDEHKDTEIRKNDKVIKSIIHRGSDSWLRVYPAPRKPNEDIYSIVFRYIMCQLGLVTFLVFWTAIWVLIIHHFEEPFETKVSMDFQREQNQLVIDLATELRQITPLSPKWRSAIEARIEGERQLTIAAVGHGARLHPGHFWDPAGSFLFTVYVMTALGFGAPVPQTMWGRTSTLIYAAFAVPTHFFLMLNLSTCIVVHADYCIHRYKLFFIEKPSFDVGKNALDKDSPNCSGNSELIKSNRSCFRRKIIRLLRILFMGGCVPLAAILYYVLGLTSFGIARSRQPLEVIMFPLEFTTSGGLEHVQSYVRILYGFYVEGAMVMLSCALATMRRNSSGPLGKMADKYRLFTNEDNNE